MPGYKLIIKNSKVILKSAANYIINLFGIKDDNTGTGNVTNGFIDWKIQHYTNTAANFTTENPTLLVGQIGIETDALTTAPKFKIGDGVTAWNSLPYNASGGAAASWGAITGTLSNQTDLQTALNNKLNLSGSNANQDIDIGNYSLNGKSLHIKGTGGNGHLGLKHQSSNITANASESSLGADSSGNPVWKNDGNAIESIELQTNKTSTVTGNETSTSKYLTVKGVYDWVTGLFVKKGTLTANTIPKATSSDTIGDGSITDDGSTVTVNNKLSVFKNTVGTGQKGLSINFNTIGEVLYIDDNGFLVYNANAGATFKGSNGIIDVVSNGGTEPILTFKYNNGSNTSGLIKGSGGKLIIDTPLLELSQLTASKIVETDASKNLVSSSYSVSDLVALAGNGISRSVLTGQSGSVTAGSNAKTDYVYIFTSTGTLTLPTAIGNTNRYTVKNRHSSTITVNFTSGQNADGSTTLTLQPFTSLDFISDNSNYNII